MGSPKKKNGGRWGSDLAVFLGVNEVRKLLARRHLIRYSSTCIVNSISQRMCNDKYVSKYHVDSDNGNNHSKGGLYSPGGVNQAPISFPGMARNPNFEMSMSISFTHTKNCPTYLRTKR